MNTYKVEVFYPNHTAEDHLAHTVLHDIRDLGDHKIDQMRSAQLYLISGDLISSQVAEIGEKLLADPVTQNFRVHSITDETDPEVDRSANFVIEIFLRSGVTDSVGESVKKGITDLGLTGVTSVKTGRKFWIDGDLKRSEIETIVSRLLANDVIEICQLPRPEGRGL